MPVDKEGALMILAEDQNAWMQAYQALGSGGRVIRHKKLPNKPSKRFRFLAWSAGMPPKSSYLRKTSDVLPENTWYDGTHLRYQESNPRFRWLAAGHHNGTHSGGDDDDDDDDDACCADCANHALPCAGQPAPLNHHHMLPLAGQPPPAFNHGLPFAGGQPPPLAGYAPAAYPQYMPAPQPCQEVQWAAPGPAPALGRRFARMAPPPPNDEGDNWIWRDGPIGPVRYSKPLSMPICDEMGTSPGVEQYRCG